jgi:hypothetical protein
MEWINYESVMFSITGPSGCIIKLFKAVINVLGRPIVDLKSYTTTMLYVYIFIDHTNNMK